MSIRLARSRRAQRQQASFPTRQLFVLALCRVCEPIAFMSIFPYVYYMVSSFHISKDEKSNAMYAGMVTSAFAFAEFSTSVVWGRLSDRFGRKPILLTGLAGTGISMVVFGFSPNLATALIARALGGLLNGNIGVINTTVAEVVTVEAHQPRAFSIMPGVWCIGGIIGSGLGGILAEPVRNYPSYFSSDSIFARFPYLLPNVVCAVVVILSMVVGILFLEETHEDMKDRRDIGLEVGGWLLGLVRSQETWDEKAGYEEESYHLLEEAVFGQASEYSSIESSPTLGPISLAVGEPSDQLITPLRSDLRTSDKQLRRSGAFTRQVIILIISFGFVAYHTISAEQLLPVLLSLPEADKPVDLPFKFSGGFELPTKSIGSILSVQGIIQTFATLIVFPWVSGKLGCLATFRIAVLSYPLLYLLMPYLTVLPATLRMPALYFMLVWKVTAQAFAFPPLQILLANSAPSKRVLGTLNGTAASSASLCRALGPTLSGFIQSAGLSIGAIGLPWWTSSAVAIVGAVLSLLLRPQQSRSSRLLASDSEASQLTLAAGSDIENVAAKIQPADIEEDFEPLPPRKH